MLSYTAPRQIVTYEPRGGARDLLECRDNEVLLEGPVGTGKTFALLWKGHLAAILIQGLFTLTYRLPQQGLGFQGHRRRIWRLC